MSKLVEIKIGEDVPAGAKFIEKTQRFVEWKSHFYQDSWSFLFGTVHEKTPVYEDVYIYEVENIK